MGFLGFVKCQFKQDFFFILFVKVLPCVFAKSFQGEIIKWAKNLAKNWRKDALKKKPYFSADLRCTKIQFQLLDRHYCRCCFSEMWARKTLKKITRICFSYTYFVHINDRKHKEIYLNQKIAKINEIKGNFCNCYRKMAWALAYKSSTCEEFA